MEKPRYFRVRKDIFEHKKTSWMRPEHFTVFCLCGVSSLLGILQMSPKMIGRKCHVDVEHIESVIAQLQAHKLIMWWPDHELMWNIECASESGIYGSAWLSAQREWRTLPEDIREAVAERYPILNERLDGKGRVVGPGVGPVVPPGVGPRGKIEKVSTSNHINTYTNTYNYTNTYTNDLLAPILGALAEARKQLGVGSGRSRALSPKRKKLITARLKEGSEVEDWISVIGAQCNSLTTGLRTGTVSIEQARAWMTIETCARPSNFARLLDAADAPEPEPDKELPE